MHVPFRSSLVGVMLMATALVVPFSTSAQVSAIRSGVQSAASAAELSTPRCSGTGCLLSILGQVIQLALAFTGVILLALLIYAGFQWMTAEKDGVTEAKTTIRNAIAGLILITASYAISTFVLDQLSTLTGGAGSGGAAPSGQTQTTDTGGTGTNGPRLDQSTGSYVCSCTFTRAGQADVQRTTGPVPLTGSCPEIGAVAGCITACDAVNPDRNTYAVSRPSVTSCTAIGGR